MHAPLIDTDWLAANLHRPELRVLDCSVLMRTAPDGTYGFAPAREEWLESHVPGSQFVDVLAELADPRTALPMMMPPVDDVADAFARYGVGDGTFAVLYDRGNHAWAARVWWMLRAAGFDAASVLDGGWQKWVAEGRPTTADTASFAAARFTPRPRPELFVDRHTVRAALASPDVALVNALSPAEYRGEAKTRLPRAGRIPGSHNVHCQALVDPVTHAYLPIDELRRVFDAAGVLGAARTVTYCGGGIAASSDALALTLLGVPNVAVYDGSLSEWAADPTLPLERG